MKKFINYLLEILLILVCSILTIITKEFLIIPIFILIIYIINLKTKIKQQNFEIKNLNYINESTREFRHDFNNIMQAMGGYIQTNDFQNLKKYYNDLIPECFHINSLYRFHSQLMANSAIYSIIAYKYNLAEKNHIKMNLTVLTNLNEINLDSYHLTRILGILLDNAIEASKECQTKIVNISFEYKNNKQFIIIENTYFSRKIPIEKLFTKNFSTKKRKLWNRFMGNK